ncbi:PREDICTED: uncharacterized protein LOC109480376 [Branchiostoma belcheri]|uniref:Uncharacterized protein LOC109480376 n=1 Tax=Branchiostoma belcheri TaxID=7741 RepID=A0A6P4ZVV2_BRABE|nr:PREDICTED: uncharacterized protein LOC109480376 [Branchiostoma belcheri]
MAFNVLRLVVGVLVVLRTASAGPVCDCSQKSTGKILKLRVHENSAEFEQAVEIHAEKNMQIFHVPQHNRVDKSDIMHDFNQHLTMIRFPDKKVCYLAPLAEGRPIPEDVESGFQQAKTLVPTMTVGTPTSRTWNVVRPAIDDRSFLTEDMAMFCAKFPIYRVEEAAGGQVTVTLETDEGKPEEKPPNTTTGTPGIAAQNDMAPQARQESGGSMSCVPVTCMGPICTQCLILGESCEYYSLCHRGTCETQHVMDAIQECCPICCSSYGYY